MGLTIDMPTAGLLGITNAATANIINTTATLTKSSVNILQGSVNYTITFPSSNLSAGDEIVLKKLGTATVTVASTLIEGTNQTITITERIYSLKTTTTSTSNTLTTKHYFDRWSYSGTNGSSSTNFNILLEEGMLLSR